MRVKEVTVAYWEDAFREVTGQWGDIKPVPVLWVDVPCYGKLLGADHYWVKGSLFGMYNHKDYGGRQASMWKKTSEGVFFVGERFPKKGTKVMDGCMIPNDVWYSLLK